MTSNSLVLLAVFLMVLLLTAKPLGAFIASAIEPSGLLTALKPAERRMFGLLGIDPGKEMNWREYAYSLIMFNALAALWVYILQRNGGMKRMDRTTKAWPLAVKA